MSKGTILAVDDESQIREVCQRTLERLGFDVKVAGTGEQAVALLRDHEFDFVLTDIKMPGSIDGPMLAVGGEGPEGQFFFCRVIPGPFGGPRPTGNRLEAPVAQCYSFQQNGREHHGTRRGFSGGGPHLISGYG